MSTPQAPSGRRTAVAVSLGAGIPVVGLVIAGIAVLPLFTQTTTSVSGLAVGSKPASITVDEKGYGFDDTTWVVPVDADWATFPIPSAPVTGAGCTDDQFEWLTANSTNNQHGAAFELLNAADSGQRLSIHDLRLVGEYTPGEDSLRVHCEATGGGQGGVPMVITSVQAGSDAPAVVSPSTENIEGADVDYTPGSPVVFNLRPGDTAQVVVDLHAPVDGTVFTGSLVATVTSGDEEAEITLSPGGKNVFTLASPSLPTAMINIFEGLPSCGYQREVMTEWFDEKSGVPCDTAAIVARLAAGWDSGAAAGIAGTWRGAVLGDTTSYSITVTIADDGVTASASAAYPEVPCTTSWAQASRSGSTVAFTETVPAGSPCYDNVPVTITRGADGQLLYSALSNGRTITATLTRSG